MQEQIKILRKEIDLLDDKIIQLLSERFLISGKIIDIKESHSEKVYDPKREEEIISRLTKTSNLPPKSLRSIYSNILDEVKKSTSLTKRNVLK